MEQVYHIAMADHDAFGSAGRARSVNNIGKIIGRHVGANEGEFKKIEKEILELIQ